MTQLVRDKWKRKSPEPQVKDVKDKLADAFFVLSQSEAWPEVLKDLEGRTIHLSSAIKVGGVVDSAASTMHIGACDLMLYIRSMVERGTAARTKT